MLASHSPPSNIAPFRLLSLPPEVRQKIYLCYLGDRLIHIDQQTRCDECYPVTRMYGCEKGCPVILRGHVCTQHCKEDREDHGMIEGPRECQPNSWIETMESRHLRWFLSRRQVYRDLDAIAQTTTNVFDSRGGDYEREALAEEKTLIACQGPLHLCLLRTCHQIHDEASKILFSTNAFAFRSSETYNRFMKSTPPAQKGWIKDIRFWVPYFESYDSWNDYTTASNVKSLVGLRRLQVRLQFHEYHPQSYLDSRGNWYPGDERYSKMEQPHCQMYDCGHTQKHDLRFSWLPIRMFPMLPLTDFEVHVFSREKSKNYTRALGKELRQMVLHKKCSDCQAAIREEGTAEAKGPKAVEAPVSVSHEVPRLDIGNAR